DRVVAAGAASTFEVRTCLARTLELLRRSGCAQPGPRAITQLPRSVGDPDPVLQREPVLAEFRSQGCDFPSELELLRRIDGNRVDEGGDRAQAIEAYEPPHR